VLAYFVDDGWERCCDRSIALLEFGGLGHSLAIHSKDEAVIMRFFEEKPAFRIVVNTTSCLGAVGYTTGLVPAMTLGPGTWAGSSTSDNVGPMHLVNIKRLAYETREFVGSGKWDVGSGTVPAKPQPTHDPRPTTPDPRTPTPHAPLPTPQEVKAMVDDFLRSHRSSRGKSA